VSVEAVVRDAVVTGISCQPFTLEPTSVEMK
jgi:hypothetical protein